jgi:hypothetical protein
MGPPHYRGDEPKGYQIKKLLCGGHLKTVIHQENADITGCGLSPREPEAVLLDRPSWPRWLPESIRISPGMKSMCHEAKVIRPDDGLYLS